MRKFILLSSIALSAVIVLFFYNNIYSKNISTEKYSSEEYIDIENSIIINGIEIESDMPLADREVPDGRIIYDNSFDNSIKSNNKTRNNHTTLKSLKSRDSRWHLTKYKIRKKDNLWKIAKKYRVRHDLIIKINNIRNPDMLKPGKYINIPNRIGVSYKIRIGDTLAGISKKFRVKSRKIKLHNNIKSNLIIAGKKLFIPDGRYIKKKNIQYTAKKWNNKKLKKIRLAKRKIKLLWPLKGKITSGFGRRKDPFSGKRKFHAGLDISANIGTPVRAALSGKVIYSGWKHRYGKIIVIRHKNGYITVYAHNSKNFVKKKSEFFC